jgi:hypothetical protein
MNLRNGFSLLVVALIILGVLVIGGGGYYFLQREGSGVVVESPRAEVLTDGESLGENNALISKMGRCRGVVDEVYSELYNTHSYTDAHSAFIEYLIDNPVRCRIDDGLWLVMRPKREIQNASDGTLVPNLVLSVEGSSVDPIIITDNGPPALNAGYNFGGNVPDVFFGERMGDVLDVFYGGVIDSGPFVSHHLVHLPTGRKLVSYRLGGRLIVEKEGKRWEISLVQEPAGVDVARINGLAVNGEVVRPMDVLVEGFDPSIYGFGAWSAYVVPNFGEFTWFKGDETKEIPIEDRVVFLDGYSKVSFDLDIRGGDLDSESGKFGRFVIDLK